MRLPFLHKHEKLFELLQRSSSNIVASASALVDMMENYENVPDKAAMIKELEHVGDEIIHTIMNNLRHTFVTPIDKEDISLLGQRQDDVVDAIEEVARLLVEYQIEKPTSHAVELARIILQCSRILDPFPDFLQRGRIKLEEIIPIKDELNLLEEQANQVTSRAMGELFDAYDVIDILKWKDIYDQLDGAADSFEDIAGIIEAIAIKNT